MDEEALWGGDLIDAMHHDSGGKTVYLRRLHFGKKLRRGQTHEFALRSWITRDPEPCTEIHIEMTIPCECVAIDVHYLGPHLPMSCWRFGPVADEALVPLESEDENAVPVSGSRRASTLFLNPEPGALHGLRWQW